MGNVTQYLQNLHLPQIGPAGLFAILALVVILLAALSLGRTRSLISLLSIYVAFALQTVFPFFAWLHSVLPAYDLPTIRVFVFLAFYALVFVILNQSVLLTRFNLSEAAPFSVVIIGVIQLALMVSIIINLAPSFYSIDEKIPAAIMPYIATQKALFWWTLLPLLMVFIGNSKRNR
ncbi:MAG TPA: hypothetical protein VFK07_03060 [Candidatus Paceibacterota bacterium]|nr:hypothetical protein [Candidatus Paceibacterota bacterium]